MLSITSRKWFGSIFAQHKIDFSLHVFVVDGLTFLVIDSSSHLRWFLVKHSPPVLVQKPFRTHYAVQHTARFIDVFISHQYGPGYEF